MERFVGGDRAAMDTLVSRHVPSIYAYALRLSRNSDVADDVVSNTFIRANRAASGFKGRCAFGTWLHTLARNCYYDLRRRALSRHTESLGRFGSLGETVELRLEAAGPTPYDLAEGEARNRVLLAAIGNLPDNQRAIIALFHLEMLTYEDISDLTEIPIGTIKSRLHRARATLKKALESERYLLGSAMDLAA